MNNRFAIALGLVTLTGFIALSYEICWIRLYSFASGSLAWVFGAMLGTYLIGLALGSLWSLRFQDAELQQSRRQLRALSYFVLAANVVGFLVVPIVSYLVTSISYLWTLPLVALAVALLGATLPLICHFAIAPDEKAGARLSYLYLANILGSGAGSLFTGFVLMDRLSLQQICVLLFALGLALAVALAFYSQMRGRALAAQLVTASIVATSLVAAAPALFDGLWERLQFKRNYVAGERFDLVVESRFGVITIDKENKIYGGGMFDGVLNTDLEPGSWLVRPYFISAVHPEPKDVLVICVSGGVWTQIAAHHPQVESVTAVEINAAYAERVIPQIDEVKSLLTNPKVTFVTDDGRRWLRRNPDKKFDVILSNTTWHYREHASSLLSKEFQEQVKAALKPGGVFIFNATGSDRVGKTTTEVFPHSALLLNNYVASNEPLIFDKERWQETLLNYEIDGRKSVPGGEPAVAEITSMLDTIDDPDVPHHQRLWTRNFYLDYDGHGGRRVRDASIITDDNLGDEFQLRSSR